MRRFAWAAAALLLLSTTPALHAQESVVIRADRVIDGTGAVLSPGAVRVEGNLIVEVGAEVDVPRGTTVIELGDATVLPGLIDLHTHLTDAIGAHWEGL